MKEQIEQSGREEETDKERDIREKLATAYSSYLDQAANELLKDAPSRDDPARHSTLGELHKRFSDYASAGWFLLKHITKTWEFSPSNIESHSFRDGLESATWDIKVREIYGGKK